MDYAIIGAGLTGLVTAYELKKRGFSVLVLEKDSRPGGFVQSVSQDGFIYERGPNSGVISNSEVEELLSELSPHCDVVYANESVKNRFILKENRWEKLPLNPFAILRSKLFTLKDKLRLLIEPFLPKGNREAETLEQLIVRRFGRSVLDYAVEPFISGVYAGNPADLVTRHALPKMYAHEQKYGSFIGGMVKRVFQKNKEPRASRKLYSFNGGMQTLTDTLYKLIGEDSFCFNVENVVIENSNSELLVQYVNDGKHKSITVPKVIATVQGYQLESLFPQTSHEKFTSLKQQEYAEVIEVVLGFRKWAGIELNGFGGLVPFKENRDILGAIFLSSCFESRAPEGGALLTVFLGGTRHPDVLKLTDEEIQSTVQQELTELMEMDSFSPDVIEILRHKMAIPQYDKEHPQRLAEVSSLENAYPGLTILGNVKDGIGMSDRIKQARTFVQSIK